MLNTTFFSETEIPANQATCLLHQLCFIHEEQSTWEKQPSSVRNTDPRLALLPRLMTDMQMAT